MPATTIDDRGPAVRARPLSQALGRAALAAAGWRVVGALPADEPKYVVVVAPHTSNWDFLLGLAAMFAVGLRAHWLGKHTLFRGPLGTLLRRLGGEPVRRDTPEGAVGAAIERFDAHAHYVLGLSPEGTRRRVARWRSGYHRIARGAGVPIVPVWLDYSRREIGIGAPLWPGPDAADDGDRLRALYRSGMARFPERYAERDDDAVAPPPVAAGPPNDR
ncbi:MAG TPA: 1-acyl-sn-glycerol-3-phosphate acyltransferase [Gemmatimonadaceae bacterium]|nr:1-acyl-sn-glycerol-3-phosphate acyltransferase [Gemmatimonadaceae bacterium]